MQEVDAFYPTRLFGPVMYMFLVIVKNSSNIWVFHSIHKRNAIIPVGFKATSVCSGVGQFN